MKSKAHGSMKSEIKGNLARLMTRAGYNPKTLSEAADLNRGYVGAVLLETSSGRSMGPEAMVAIAGALGRALGRDSRIVTLQILGFNTDDLKGGKDATLLEIAIADTVDAVTPAAEAPAAAPAKAAKPKAAKPKAEPKAKAPKAAKPAKEAKAKPAKAEPKPKAAKAAKPAAEPKAEPEAAPAIPVGMHVFSWGGTTGGKAVRLVCLCENLTQLCKVAGIGKSTAYGKVQESSNPEEIKAAVARPKVALMAYDTGAVKAKDFKSVSEFA